MMTVRGNWIAIPAYDGFAMTTYLFMDSRLRGNDGWWEIAIPAYDGIAMTRYLFMDSRLRGNDGWWEIATPRRWRDRNDGERTLWYPVRSLLAGVPSRRLLEEKD